VFTTPRSIRQRNQFEYAPILEVASLFVGIFVAMIPATMLLQAHGGALGVTKPWQYFWATGALSAFLDNAPTYVTFAAMACGVDPTCTSAENLAPLATGESAQILVAISLGSVFCGAGSYIGNGPNFMVRAIAEASGYKMPSFFGYVGYAAAFLGPVFALATLIWLV
jgi:Na+/H+ antiporter NhaD/arsenite permease-like protein